MTRVGDPERERTALTLRRHYVEGRLDEAELSERLELVLRARSRRDLRIALGQLPRWGEVEHLATRARHGVVVAVATVTWLMLTTALFVAFLVWLAANGATLGGLIAFPLAWLVVSALLYRRTVVSRRRLHRP
jgi:hypothetical protein